MIKRALYESMVDALRLNRWKSLLTVSHRPEKNAHNVALKRNLIAVFPALPLEKAGAKALSDTTVPDLLSAEILISLYAVLEEG